MSAVRQATILVLERNAALQDLIDQALRDAGHRVLSTGDPREALELVRRVRVDVVVAGALLETHMEELLSELRLLQPSVAVVGISSPFALDELVEAVDPVRLPMRQQQSGP